MVEITLHLDLCILLHVNFIPIADYLGFLLQEQEEKYVGQYDMPVRKSVPGCLGSECLSMSHRVDHPFYLSSVIFQQFDILASCFKRVLAQSKCSQYILSN